MKHIKFFKDFINEALRDEIPSHISDIIKDRHGDKYLDMDVPKHTDLIPNIKIEVKDESISKRTTQELKDIFIKNIEKQFMESDINNLLQKHKFANILYDSLGDKNFDDIISCLKNFYSKDFRLIDSKSTPTNIIFSNNKSNIYGFIKSYNRVFNNEIVYDIDKDKKFNGLRNVILNIDENIYNIENSKLYLYITDKPTDKLLMSVSRYYDSCQNIYNGDQNDKLLSNVFDINSKLALLIYDTPYIDTMGNTVPYTSIARTIIRCSDNNIMFDKVYPSNMRDNMYKIIEEYTGLEHQSVIGAQYKYTPISGLPRPYMDTYTIQTEKTFQYFLEEKFEGRDLSTIDKIDGRDYSFKDLKGIEKLTNLKYLSLSGNDISDLSPLKNLSLLTTLNCSYNNLSSLKGIENLTNLTKLQFVGNNINDLEALKNLINITYLDCSDNIITNLEPLKNLTNIEKIICSDNLIRNIDVVKNMTKLSYLNCDNNNIKSLKGIEYLENLEDIIYSNNDCSIEYGGLSIKEIQNKIKKEED